MLYSKQKFFFKEINSLYGKDTLGWSEVTLKKFIVFQ